MLFTMREMYVDRNPKMEQPVQNINYSAFRSMFEREKHSGNNFNDCFRQLKLLLRVEKKIFVIEQPLPAAPAADSDAQVLSQWNAIYDAYNEVACLILCSMTPKLHRQFENSSPYDMIKELKAMFEKQARVESGKIQKANKKSLKAKGKGKDNGKEKDKQFYIPKPRNPKPTAKEHPTTDDTYHHCKEKKKQVGSASSSDIFTIELFAFLNKFWVYDTGCGTNICITKQGFREARKLKQGALYLYVGNGVRAQVEAIGSYDLVLPNGLVICLDNCHYAPSILRGVVSVHRLVENGFVQRFTDFGISVSKNNVHYFNVIPSNGIYEIDMHNLVPNVNSIYNVSTKRAKHNLDYTYLWHCRLAHISKKRIEKLQQEGLLKSTDDESFDQCVSCLSGKMTRKSFPHRPERATDLLGIIHTDVCGPLRHVSKQEKYASFKGSIFGLKQASRSWNKRFDEKIKIFGFTQNLDEPCVYQKASGSNVTFLILYVDDIIIMGNHIPSLQSVKDYLGRCFAMKDLGEATFILGIKIYRDRSKRLIGLGQNAYMDKILKRYKMDNSKRGHIPMQERLDLNKTQGASTPKEVKRMQNVPYASAVGSIMYAVRCTRPDVAFAQNITSRFQQNPGAVDWKSSKQSTTAMSATEAEYIAAMEAVWIIKFISGLGIVPTMNEPIRIFCDNSATLHFANEPGVQRGARHYHMRYHYVCESIALGEIRFLKVHTDDNLADPFTKALSKGKLTQHARSMGLRLASSFM
ncbi:retrotransposon protein, putative, ty1-copia subclass [Tanacetum coccineum]|uniref:Retrotransposon protein, putative, ty1-copia subclass n=1 Tax=Tanacetum coccineum TaxID=301880 RepID=A0ABQ5FW84_9ASTR